LFSFPALLECSLPLSYRTPSLQGESSTVRIDEKYFSKLHCVKTQLSELFYNFKEGTRNTDVEIRLLPFVHGTESDDFIDRDNTLQFELRKNKVTYNVSYLFSFIHFLFNLVIINSANLRGLVDM
jgi:hypothetical protein